MFKYVHHIEYVIRNRDELVAYVERKFGMKPSEIREKDGGRGKEARYKVGQTLVRFLEPAPGTKQAKHLEEHGPGIDHVSWGVDDIEQAAKQLKAKGIGYTDEATLRKDRGMAPSQQGFTGINMDQKDTLGVFFQIAQQTAPAGKSQAGTGPAAKGSTGKGPKGS